MARMNAEQIRAIALEVAKKVYGITQEADYEEVFNVEEDEFHLQLCASFLAAITEKAEPVGVVNKDHYTANLTRAVPWGTKVFTHPAIEPAPQTDGSATNL